MDSLIAKADAMRPVAKRRKTGDKPGPSKSKHGRTSDGSKKAKESSQPEKASETLISIKSKTSLPRSLRPTSPPPKGVKKHAHITNKSLRLELDRRAEQTARSQALRADVALLTEAVGADAGRVEVEDEMERTWRVGQAEIVREVGVEAARQQKEYKLDGGPYRVRYTRNGRHLAIVGKLGHVASFDWQTGTMHAELQLRETCRDITYLHDQSHFAVAQKKYAFIYDQNGVELHKLKNHVEPTRLEFLPYHWLLASVGNSGHLKYQDTSTGQLVASHRTGLGSCHTLAQNPQTAVLYLGHQNGRVTLWTPNLAHPAVSLLAHRGGITGLSVDPSDSGRYLATAGVDGLVKVWDSRTWGVVREWTTRGGGGEVEWSAKGTLAVASGGTVNTYNPPHNHTPIPSNPRAPPPLYLTHPIPSRPLTSLRFCPFSDVLTIGHARGLSSILIPGSGEPHFDSGEADPFENKHMRREREVRNLLDKIAPELITFSGPAPGSLAPPSKLTLPGGEGQTPDLPFSRLPRIDRLKVAGKYDPTEEVDTSDTSDGDDDSQEEGEGDGVNGEGTKSAEKTKKVLKERIKKKMRGKNKSMKRYLRKHRKNVIDPQTVRPSVSYPSILIKKGYHELTASSLPISQVAIRAKLEKQREERRRALATSRGGETTRKPSVLDRFRRDTR
ncbi:BING4CT-domain-containing protein [Fomitiporia mediterranea MF3/22]|uniref:BING4CT-domain-containing protein n=1 Tax=Fomitiporia mediterranea (strain MF3/22) TaxID=694068 RepID=UPI0004408DBE|nr:BING4CT-domain-containing protein [Fomitiporia mediterranea MF3/22]EJD08528.1 BING4CT-domain-containing protein [Fomitiporia mediterranea MF3/22]